MHWRATALGFAVSGHQLVLLVAGFHCNGSEVLVERGNSGKWGCCVVLYQVLPQTLLRKCLQRQHTRAQKFRAGPTIHCSFKSL